GGGSSTVVTGTPGPNGQIIANLSGGFDVQMSGIYPDNFSATTFEVQVIDGVTTLFSDDFESGAGKWPTPGCMTITTAQSSSPTHGQSFTCLGSAGNAFSSFI